jgi:hypothetical protein
MDGLGRLFGEVFGEMFEVAGERMGEAMMEPHGERRGPDLRSEDDRYGTTRFLAGGPRTLNVNDR